MIYHGVHTEEGVLMRMNGVPRSIAEQLGAAYRESGAASQETSSLRTVRSFLESAEIEVWNQARTQGAQLDATGYREVWRILSGEDTKS